jgi:hypothetical protein
MKAKMEEKKNISQEEMDQMIRKRAQDIYYSKGSEGGRDMENWLEAEKQVKRELKAGK